MLAGLAAAIRRDDPWFAYGLRVGWPVAPREYREPGERPVVAVLVAVQVVMLVAGWNAAVVAVGIATLAWSARRR